MKKSYVFVIALTFAILGFLTGKYGITSLNNSEVDTTVVDTTIVVEPNEVDSIETIEIDTINGLIDTEVVD